MKLTKQFTHTGTRNLCVPEESICVWPVCKYCPACILLFVPVFCPTTALPTAFGGVGGGGWGGGGRMVYTKL